MFLWKGGNSSHTYVHIFLFVLSAWRLFAVKAQDEEEEGGYRSVLPRIPRLKMHLKVFTNEKKGG
jgi:hypothetical protein